MTRRKVVPIGQIQRRKYRVIFCFKGVGAINGGVFAQFFEHIRQSMRRTGAIFIGAAVGNDPDVIKIRGQYGLCQGSEGFRPGEKCLFMHDHFHHLHPLSIYPDSLTR